MGTATSSGSTLALLAALALWAAGCGGSSVATRPASSPSATRTASVPAGAPGFAWLRAAAVPQGWPSERLSSGATLAYPGTWQRIPGDLGTVSAALLGTSAHERYVAYLNVTPRQANETLVGWAAFRVRHNRAEGDREVRLEASARNLRFRDGTGSCVRDSYATITRAHYIEIACLVEGRYASSVIVGATPPERWSQTSPMIERAIAAFTT